MKRFTHRLLARVAQRRVQTPSTEPITDAATLNRLGDHHLRTHAEDDALAFYLRAADTWARDGFYAKSIAVYRKVLRLRPDHSQARERLTWTYVASGLPIDIPR
ncbi:MAG: hypothetical protein AAGC60_10835 [Acidobacteriota bacterium]